MYVRSLKRYKMDALRHLEIVPKELESAFLWT